VHAHNAESELDPRCYVVDAVRSAFDVLQSLQNAGGHRKEAEGGRGENWANCLL